MKKIIVLICLIASFNFGNSEAWSKDIVEAVDSQPKKTVSRKAVKKRARITKYVKTGNRMANMLHPEEGYVAVSDRSIKKGSLIWIDRERYIVGDYTAKWVHQKSLDEGCDLTVDIFTDESREEALRFGKKSKNIVIIEKE